MNNKTGIGWFENHKRNKIKGCVVDERKFIRLSLSPQLNTQNL